MVERHREVAPDMPKQDPAPYVPPKKSRRKSPPPVAPDMPVQDTTPYIPPTKTDRSTPPVAPGTPKQDTSPYVPPTRNITSSPPVAPGMPTQMQKPVSYEPDVNKAPSAPYSQYAYAQSIGVKSAQPERTYTPSVYRPDVDPSQIQYDTAPKQTYEERLMAAGIEGVKDSKPMSAFSRGIYERASGVSESIRRGEPKLSSFLERQSMYQQSPGMYGFSKVIGYPVRSTASFIEMGGMIPGGVETIAKTPSIIPTAVAMGAYQSTVGLGREFKKDPAQVTSDIATGAVFFGAAGRVKSVTSKVPYRVGIGAPRDVIIKASDVYIPKTKPPTPGSQLVKYKPPKPTTEYFVSKLRRPTEYGGTADIYMKVPKSKEAALAKTISKQYEVELGTARFQGKSHQVIEPIRKITPDKSVAPSGLHRISPRSEPIQIGKAPKSRRIFGGKKLSDYVRVEKKLDLDKIDITMKEAGAPRKQITDFPESKIIDTTLVSDTGPTIKPRADAFRQQYTKSSLSRFMLSTSGEMYLGSQLSRPIASRQRGITELEEMPLAAHQTMPVVKAKTRTQVMERTDEVRYDLSNLKVKPAETPSISTQYKPSTTIRPTTHTARSKARDAVILPVYSDKITSSPAPSHRDKPIIAPVRGFAPQPYFKPALESSIKPFKKAMVLEQQQVDVEPHPTGASAILVPPPPIPPVLQDTRLTPEITKKRKLYDVLEPKKKKAFHPWFPASLEYVNIEEGITGKRAVHIKSRTTTQRLFKGLITTGRGIQTKAQYERNLRTKIM